MDKETSEKTFATVADVLDYLEGDGWKVTKTSLYRHREEGKLLPQRDGSYARKDVDKYARTWLRQQSTGKRISQKTDELQRRRLDLELDVLEIQKKRNQLAYEKDLGLLVRKEEMEIELAMWVGILDVGFTNWIKSHAAEWIRMVDGNMRKVGEFTSQMLHEKDKLMNSYASTTEYNVVIDAEEDMKTGEETIMAEEEASA
jgi:hypothetical protein